MNTYDCIHGRRSIRKYTDQTVSRDTISSIVADASFSPSWKNTQIVRYIAVEHSSLKDRIVASVSKTHTNNASILANAPMIIALTVVKYRSGYERDGSYTTSRKDTWQMFDAGIAAQTFCLSAFDHGLGTVIVGIFDEMELSQLLSIPSDRELVALIALGYSDHNPICPQRKEVSELLTYV